VISIYLVSKCLSRDVLSVAVVDPDLSPLSPRHRKGPREVMK
jgi:hypothetical protein